MITVERDPRTREIVITGPDGFAAALEDNVIVHQQLLRLQRLLNEVYEAGKKSPRLDVGNNQLAPRTPQ